MKKWLLPIFMALLACCLLASCRTAQDQDIIEDDPIEFDGATLRWGDKTITLDDHNIYLDGKLSEADVAGCRHVYRTFNEACAALVPGTEDNPMNVWIAPYVYWVHDPDSPSTTEAFQITISDISNLHLTGLTNRPENVVIAMNYGHNEGLDGGNPTMLKVSGDGLTLANITFGGYCNIDLIYPLDPTLNRSKRTTNITQCQLASYDGDKLYAYNCNFVSRLNMMPFNNSKRALYVNCHFESTDDSLNGSSKAVYVDCDFEFWGTKPWGGSNGVTLLGCEFLSTLNNVGSNPYQYLSKGGGQFVLVDCNYTDSYTIPVTFGFSDVNNDTYRAYVSNVTRNGKPLEMKDLNNDRPAVDITDTEILKNYKLIDASGNVIYNTYNLLKGDDDWDPQGIKEKVETLASTFVTTSFGAAGSAQDLTSGSEDEILITTNGGSGTISYFVKAEDEIYVILSPADDGRTCKVKAKTVDINDDVRVIVDVRTSDGHDAAVGIDVRPTPRSAPTISDAEIEQTEGSAVLSYSIDMDGDLTEVSKITWYIADDAKGTNRFEIAVGRSDEPLRSIKLTHAFAGKYILATIAPQSNLSEPGRAVEVASQTTVKESDIAEGYGIYTDLSSISLSNHALKKGFWTVDGHTPGDVLADYKPLDSDEVSTKYSAKVNGKFGTPSEDSWAFGTGKKNGFLNYTGLYHISRGARLYYTPEKDFYGDMDLTVKMAPGKTASQGFGSDYQYMDIMIKFDFNTVTGYGLRIYRKSGGSCEFVLMKYSDGRSKEICEPVEAKAYITECTAHVWTENGKLKANVTTSAEVSGKTTVDLVADIEANTYGSFGLLNTGTTGDNTTYIGSLEVSWD